MSDIIKKAHRIAVNASKTHYASRQQDSIKLWPYHYKPKCIGFDEIINTQEYEDALFIFNDDTPRFLDFYNNRQKSTSGSKNSGGNACIRSYQCKDKPRAAGIPTGQNYLKLDEDNIKYIDMSIEVIREVLDKNKDYTRVFYSADDKNMNQNLGVDIFAGQVGLDVRWYIVGRLRDLINEINKEREEIKNK